MTIQHRRRASLNKAIGDILAVDATTSMPSILEQLTAKFPNIPSPGFEGIEKASGEDIVGMIYDMIEERVRPQPARKRKV